MLGTQRAPDVYQTLLKGGEARGRKIMKALAILAMRQGDISQATHSYGSWRAKGGHSQRGGAHRIREAR